jgi:phytoene dehydrogenase-like protein
MIGGAAVTEEIFPGFKFSRFSYLAGLLRPSVINELDLHRHGLEYLVRKPSSFTPSPANGDGRYLVLGAGDDEDHASIAQFSKRDADAYFAYEHFLGQCRDMIEPLLEGPPPNPFESGASLRERLDSSKRLSQMLRAGIRHRDAVVPFYELFTGPAQQLLDRWFESEMLKTTLACDAVIGAIVSIKQCGSAYVLLHHVMGEVAGRKGVWSYARGGMGGVSDAIASAAREAGAEIVTSADVAQITHQGGRATGVRLGNGTHIRAKRAVVSNATPYHTFMELLPGFDATIPSPTLPSNPLPGDFAKHVRHFDYAGGSFKINLALSGLPNFTCWPNTPDGQPGPQHFGTIHFESKMQELEDGYREAAMGIPATRPVVEMTLPSSLDNTLAPPGQHVCQLFVQFAP